jgi:hypothetical protein
LVSFFDIISFILLSLREYVNIIRIRIIIIFVMIVITYDEYYARHHHDTLRIAIVIATII